MSELHELDAAYVLGALSSDDRRAYEEHLAGCARCTASVAELAGMPGLLSMVDRADAIAMLDEVPSAEADGAIVTRLAGVERRRRRRERVVAIVGLAAAAAAIALVAVVAPRTVAPDAGTPIAMEQVVPGVMTAELAVTEKGWGSRYDWTLRLRRLVEGDYPGGAPPTYVLVVVDDAGDEHIVASWQATGGEHAGGLTASSSVPYDAIRAVEIRYEGASEALVRTEL